jgi:hypothetical protein
MNMDEFTNKRIEEAIQDCEERIKLLRDLDKSLALEKRFPGCFDGEGPCRSYPRSTYPHTFPESFTLTVTVAGEDVTISGEDEPQTLIDILGADFQGQPI